MTPTYEYSSLHKLSQAIIVTIGVGWLLYIGSALILPIVFAILLAVFLFPLEKILSKFLKWRILSILLSFIALLLPFIVVTILFSMQLIAIVDSLPSIGQNLESGFGELVDRINSAIPFLKLDEGQLMDSGSKSLEGPLSFIGKGFISTTSFLAGFGMTILYTFFLLYYRESFNNFILYQFEKDDRPDIKQALKEIKETIQSYIGGVGIVMIILSVLNSIGLTLIGIDYAIFWGTLAGILAIVPFIGTLLGGLLPFLYALSTADARWQPVAVLLYYLMIQQVEGNFITPKVVGDRVDINPLFAIIAIVFLGAFWGISGIILALPIISILKIVLDNFENTKSYALLTSTDLGEKRGIFKKLFAQQNQIPK